MFSPVSASITRQQTRERLSHVDSRVSTLSTLVFHVVAFMIDTIHQPGGLTTNTLPPPTPLRYAPLRGGRYLRGGDLRGIPLGPLFGNPIMGFPVLQILLGNVSGERVVGVAVGEQGGDG